MSQTKTGLCVFFAAMGLTILLPAWFWSERGTQKKITDTLTREVAEKVSVRDVPGCFVFRECCIDNRGLTFFLSTDVFAVGPEFTSLEQAKKFHAKIFKLLLDRANAVRTIRPFLDEFPLTPRSFYLRFIFKDDRGQAPRSPSMGKTDSVGETCNVSGVAPPGSGEAGQQWGKLFSKPISEIPELQALYTPTLPKSSGMQKVEIPEVVALPSRSHPADVALLEFAKRFCRENGLHIVVFGTVGAHYHDIRVLDFALRGDQKLSLGEAQYLAAKCVRESFRFLSTDPQYLKSLKVLHERDAKRYPSPTPEPNHIAFRISFWDEYVDRRPAPYIAEIRLLDSVVRYFTADEYQRLQLVHQESFEEAVQRAEGQGS